VSEYATELQRILRAEGRKQRWLAAEIGIAESRVSQYVNAVLMPGPVNKRKIALALGRNPDQADALFLVPSCPASTNHQTGEAA
jgi:transcriptional regulator with XRE-family HTH domain